MGGSRIKQQRETLTRLLHYILGRRPDEFGLVPDEEGFVTLKELLIAVNEDDSFRHVRKNHLEELLLEPENSGLEIRDKLIRLTPGLSQLTLGAFEPVVPPARLFFGARRKAYPTILLRGLVPAGGPWVILSATPEMALKRGKRRDPQPVLLEIQAEKAETRGVNFFRPQELLFLVESMTPDLIKGPPLPKERPQPEKKDKKKEVEAQKPPTPGSFILDTLPGPDPDSREEKLRKKKKGDGPEWKNAVRKERRRRQNEDF